MNILAGFVIGFSALIAPLAAFAHATPTEYLPEASATVQSMPERLSIRFSERIEPHASSITVISNEGVISGESIIDTTDAHIFSTVLKPASTGSYAVSWQVVSADDGHFTKGGYVFSVGKEGESAAPESAFQITHRSGFAEASFIALELLGQAFLLAGAVLALALRTSTLDLRRLRLRSTQIGALLIILGGAGYIILKSLNLQVDTQASFRDALQLFVGTTAGFYTLLRMALLLPLAALPLLKNMQRRDWLQVFAVCCMAALRARVSHAAASEFLPAFSVLMNALHLLGKELWIGAVLLFTLFLLPGLERAEEMKATTLAWLRTNRIVDWAIGLTGVTGLYIVWLHLKGIGNFTSTHWGMTSLGLLGFTGIALGMHAYQSLAIAQAGVAASNGDAHLDERNTASSAWIVWVLQSFFGLGMLLFSSMLIITTPPLGSAHPLALTSADSAITFSEHPFEDGKWLVNAKDPQHIAAALVTLTQREQAIGPIVADLEERFPGSYAFSASELTTPAGTWDIAVTFQREGTYDSNAQFTLKLPDDVLAAHQYDNVRRIDALALTLLLMALGAIAGALLLNRYHASLERLTNESKGSMLASSFETKAVMTVSIMGLLLVSLLGFLFQNHGHGTFQALCNRNGHMWHESVPIRDGRPTSTIPAVGCMLGMGLGQYHFADQREYTYFIRTPYAQAALTSSPAALQVGKSSRLTFTLTGSGGLPVEGLTREHDRILHVLVIGQDLQTFAHVHPEDTGKIAPEALAKSTFSVPYTFPKAGRYLVAVDYTVRAKQFSQQFYVKAGGSPAMLAPQAATTDDTSGSLRLALNPATITVNDEDALNFSITESGTLVKDLQPYLAAPMHMAIVSNDLRYFAHTHGELPQSLYDRLFNKRALARPLHTPTPPTFAGNLEALVRPTKPGAYTIFAEVKKNGKVALFRVGFEAK